MARANEYLVVRQVGTEELRICPVVIGYRPPKDDSVFTWGGPYKSKAAARKAVESKCEALRLQLYPEATP